MPYSLLKAKISKLLLFRTEKIVYIYEKALQCGIERGTSSMHMHVDNPSNNYACGMLVSNTPQMNYYLTPMELCKQQNYSMECHLLWHFIISYIVYFSVSTIIICIYILPTIILPLLSCLFYKGKLYNYIHIHTHTHTPHMIILWSFVKLPT